jgi:hypothetical protein
VRRYPIFCRAGAGVISDPFTPARVPSTLARGLLPIEEAADYWGENTPTLLLVNLVELGLYS